MFKNKEERTNHLKDFSNWEVIQVIDELSITYSKLKVNNNVIKRNFITTRENDYKKLCHEIDEYYNFDESKQTLTKSCMTELVEVIKNS